MGEKTLIEKVAQPMMQNIARVQIGDGHGLVMVMVTVMVMVMVMVRVMVMVMVMVMMLFERVLEMFL